MVKRSEGKSIIAAAAYRRADKLFSEREERSYDYTDKPDVILSEFTIPHDAPAWVKAIKEKMEHAPTQTITDFWNLVDANEKRKDSQPAREYLFALPIELTKEQNTFLTKEFIQDQLAGHGMIIDWSIHWDKGNPHVHALATTRYLDADGFGKKNTAWEKRPFLVELRHQFAEYANFHLLANGHDVRIDARSYKDQGIELIPTIHEGKAAQQMRDKGVQSEIMKKANDIKQQNLQLIFDKPAVLIDKIVKQKDSFTFDDVTHEMSRYVTDKGKLSYDARFLADIALTNLDAANVASGVFKNESAPFGEDALEKFLTPEKIAALIKKIEAHDTVFSERTLMEHLSEFTDNAEIFSLALIKIKASPDLISLGAGDDGRDRYTTRSMFNVENTLVDLTDDLRQTKCAFIGKRLQRQGLKAYEKHTQKILTSEQQDVLTYMLKPSAISCIVGRAGTGKSFTLGAVASVYQAAGFKVSGIALSGIAAQGLRETGIDSRTIASFIMGLSENKIQLNAQDVLIMDEAGMTDVHSMNAVLEAVKQAGAKIILVGDHDQLQPVAGGAAFRAILERVGFKEISHVYRQHHEWQKAATKQLAAGDVESAMQSYYSRGFVSFMPTQAEATQALVNDWLSTYEQVSQDLVGASLLKSPSKAGSKASNVTIVNPYLQSADIAKHLVTLAHTNDDVDELNLLLRETRVLQGQLSDGYLTMNADKHYLAIAQGERVVFTKNDRKLDIKNGQFATITQVNFAESGRVLGFNALLDEGKMVTIEFEKYRHFDHGYAITVHKSQGITRKHAFVFAGGFGWNRHLSYVAHSRHQESCRTYSSEETHRDVNAFFKYLGRFGRKDSLIDFPLAFGLRRGFDMDATTKDLPKRLALRLSLARETLNEKAQAVFHPIRYWQEKQEKVAQTLAAEARQVEREDGRLVARYVDANRETGRAFGELAKLFQLLGFKKENYHEAFAHVLVQSSPEYQDFELAKQARNAVAAEIARAPERYAHVMGICGIDVEKVRYEASQHAQQIKVSSYHELSKNTGSVISRDREAYRLQQTIKEHYGALKSSGVDLKALREHALAHARRIRGLSLTSAEREGFKLVERYQQLTIEIAERFNRGETLSISRNDVTSSVENPDINSRGLFLGAENDAHLPTERIRILELAKLGLERDRLAEKLYMNATTYGAALDFYHIGLAAPRYEGEDITPERMKKAQDRWYKLQNQAGRHIARERVAAYEAALKANDVPLRQSIASVIAADTKAHHPVIVETVKEPRALWRIIREDARAKGRDMHLNTLSSDEKIVFEQVERYVAAKRAHGSAWREILSEKENQGLDSQAVFKQLAPHAKNYTRERDKLAADIVAVTEKPHDYLRYKTAFNYFNVDIDSLTDQAKQYHREEAVKAYVVARNNPEMSLPARGKLAKVLLDEPKAYYGLMLAEKLSWEDIFKDCNAFHAERAMCFLTPEERALSRLARRYRQTNQQIGKTLSRYQANPKKEAQGNQLTPQQQRVMGHLSSKRDYLAHQLVKVSVLANPRLPLTAFEAGLRIKAEKVTAQAKKHAERVVLAKEFQLAHRAVLDSATSLYQAFDSKHNAKPDDAALIAAMKPVNDTLAYAVTLKKLKGWILNEANLPYVLSSLGISPDMWRTQWEGLDELQTTIDKLTRQVAITHERYTPPALPEKALALIKAHESARSHSTEIDGQRLKELLKRQAEQIALTYLGEPTSRNTSRLRYGRSGKLSVTLSGAHEGEWYDFSQNVGGDMLSLISYRTGLTDFMALAEEASRFIGGQLPMKNDVNFQAKKFTSTAPVINNEAKALDERIKKVQIMVKQSVPIKGTLAERYLREHRGISGSLDSDNLSYHPNLRNWMTGTVHPALIVTAKNLQGEIVGLQATFLDTETAKKAVLGANTKLSRGLTGEGALVHQGKQGGAMAYAEGLETALSVAEAHPEWHVHLTFGVANFTKVAMKAESQAVVICADNDGFDSGTAISVEKAIHNLAEKGKDVYVAMPTKPEHIEKYDFNDLLKNEGIHAVRDALKNARLCQKGTTFDSLKTALAESLQQLQGKKIAIKQEVVDHLALTFNTDAKDSHDSIDWLHPLVCGQIEKLRDDKSESIQGLLRLHDLAKQKNAVSQALKIGLHDTLLQVVENPVLSKRIADKATLLHKIGQTLSKQLSHKRSH